MAAERVKAARRRSAADAKGSASRPGAGSTAGSTRPITPKDVADRYDKGPRKGALEPTRGGAVRADTPRSLSGGRGPGARPAKGAESDAKAKSNAARIAAVRKEAADRSKEARIRAAREKAAATSRDVRIRNARIKNAAADAKTASNNARIRTARQNYANRVASARRDAITAGGQATRPGNTLGGRSPITAVGSNGRGRGLNGGFNGSYGYNCYVDPYYNSCFWNTWGNGFSNSWCSWFWSPFYASGLCWQNYWAYGGTWGWGPRRSRFNSWNNCIWLGPFLPATSSFIVYDDPEPEIVYVEVEAEPAPVGQVVVQPEAFEGEAAGQRSLPPQGTNQELQRELNRAATYYLTQGDRAFREARFGDAAHFYAKAVEFGTDQGILYLVLSDALFATGDYRYAAYALRQAFDREPDLARNVVDKREFYADPGQFDRQLTILERYVEDHVLDMDARFVLAANYLFSGRPDSAWSLLDNPFSEELRGTPEGKLIQESAYRVMFGEPMESAEGANLPD